MVCSCPKDSDSAKKYTQLCLISWPQIRAANGFAAFVQPKEYIHTPSWSLSAKLDAGGNNGYAEAAHC